MPYVFNFKVYTFFDISMFALSGLCNYMGQITKGYALKLGDASFVTPLNYLQVVLLLMCDLALFGYSFTSTDYLGVLITFVCVIYPVIQKLTNSRKVLLQN